MTTFQTSFDFNMKTNILIILKMPFLILDMVLVLVWVNYFGNLSWQYKQLIHVSCKTRNHPQTSQNQPQISQTTHKPPKPTMKHPQTSQTSHTPAKLPTKPTKPPIN